MKKEVLRQEIILKRLEFSQTQEFDNACARICKNIEFYISQNIDIENKAITIGCYYPIKGEVDLTQFCNNTKLTLAFPRLILCKNHYEIEYAIVSSINDLTTSRLSFKEAPRTSMVCYPNILLIPGILYDRKKNRIGYGKGHFDKFIANAKKTNYNPIKIGIGFDLQLQDIIPTESHDQPMDVIITESEII